MLQADGSLRAQVATEVGGLSCGVGAEAAARGPTGVSRHQRPQAPAVSSPAQAEELWGARQAGGVGLCSWAGRPTTSGSSPLVPGHPAWGGAWATPAPRGAGGPGSFRPQLRGRSGCIHLPRGPGEPERQPTPTLAPRSGSHLCGLHGRSPGPVPSFQRLWVQSKATWSPLSAPDGCSQSCPGLAVGLPGKFTPRKQEHSPVKGPSYRNLAAGEAWEGTEVSWLSAMLH